MLTKLEKALDSIINIFHQYTKLSGNNEVIYRDDMKRMLNTETPHFMQKMDADGLLKDLDSNEDNQFDFEEYLRLVEKLLLEAYKASRKTEEGY